MPYEILIALISTGGTLGGTWLGAFLNRRSALDTAKQLADVEQHKYAKSRLWDAQKEAYTDIIIQLNAIEKLVGQILNALFDPEVDPSYYLESEQSNNETSTLWQRIWKIEDTVKNNSLILPDLFQASFSAWRADFENYDEEAEPQEVIITQSKAIDKHKPAMIKLARDELAAGPRE